MRFLWGPYATEKRGYPAAAKTLGEGAWVTQKEFAHQLGIKPRTLARRDRGEQTSPEGFLAHREIPRHCKENISPMVVPGCD
jgi:hypothetical protein